MNINKEAKIEERVVLGDLCNYSEEEKYIGIWIDGKPLYRKVIPYDIVTTGSNSFGHKISNIDKIVDMSGYIKISENTFIPVNIYVGDNYSYMYATRTLINYYSYWTGNAYYILEYTKTTD